jgi:hypothetical protein
MYANQRFINATSRGRAAQIASGIAPAIAAALRERPAPRSAPEPEPREAASGLSQAAKMIVMADAWRRGEIEMPVRAHPESPEETQASREESLRLLLLAAQGAPA